MERLSIAIGADHRGFSLKEALKRDVSMPVEWVDCGSFAPNRSDYPIFAQQVCDMVLSGQVSRGVLLCGTGAGMAMAANRYCKIYAAVVWSCELAKRVREEDHCNVLVIPADYLSVEVATEITKEWIRCDPLPGRYAERIEMVDRIGTNCRD